MQLEFKCPECGVSGLTPEIHDEKAIAVVLKELSIRCPRCSAIIEITEPLGPAKARECRALQTLRDFGRAALVREAFGVRRIPALSKPAGVSKCQDYASTPAFILAQT